MILDTDIYGRNAWNLAGVRGSLMTLQKVWKCAKEILTKEELNKLLLSTNEDGMNAWNLAQIRAVQRHYK